MASGRAATGCRRTAAAVAALASCLLAVPPYAAQQRDPQRFRTGVELIQVQATVVDATGRPVDDLTAADFELLIDGVPQRIAMFDRHGATPPPENLAAVRAGGVADNALPPDSPVVVMLMDDLHTWRERSDAARRIAHSFVEQMDFRSAIGLVYSSGGGLEITSNRVDVERTIDQFSGRGHRFVNRQAATPLDEKRAAGRKPADTDAAHGASRASENQQGDVSGAIGLGGPPAAPPVVSPRAEAAGQLGLFFGDLALLDSLERVSKQLEGSNAARKVVVLIGEGIPFAIQDPFTHRGQGGEFAHILAAVQQFLKAALRNNVTVYAFDPRGQAAFGEEGLLGQKTPLGDDELLIFDDTARMNQESLVVMAEETGGTAIVDSDDFEGGVRRIAQEIRSYYLLGFYPEPRRFDGKYRKIEVRVTRPGVTVRARKGYVDAKRPSATDEEPPTLGALASGVLPVSDLPLRLFAAAFRGADRKARVAVTLESPAHPDELQYLVGAVDLKKQSLALERSGRAAVQPHTAAPDSGGLVHVTLNLPPGRYQLRAAARSAQLDRAGSVYLDVEVPDFRQSPLMLSDLVIGYAPVDAGPAPFRPTLDRTFVKSDRLRLHAEAYLRAGPMPLDLVLRIVDAEGQEKRSDSRRLEPASSGSGARVIPLDAMIPLSELGPGAYVLQVSATAGEHTAQDEIGFRVR